MEKSKLVAMQKNAAIEKYFFISSMFKGLSYNLFEFICKNRLFSGNNSPTVGKKSLKTGKSKPDKDCQASIFR
jgi:hypothetical protein